MVQIPRRGGYRGSTLGHVYLLHITTTRKQAAEVLQRLEVCDGRLDETCTTIGSDRIEGGRDRLEYQKGGDEERNGEIKKQTTN